jgi:hypothetical protein
MITCKNAMKEFRMDMTTYGGLSVAQYVAFRSITEDEISLVKHKPPYLLGRVSNTMSRLSFVDDLRYFYRFDELDKWQCMKINELEVYLLCTCLDTLAGKNNYYDLGNWLRARSSKSGIHGFNTRERYLEMVEGSGDQFSVSLFQNALQKIIEIYTVNYGINQNIRQLLLNLPEGIKKTITDQYLIFRAYDRDGGEALKNKSFDDKIKTIFIDYLFRSRRNKYTHEGTVIPSIGGICSAREALSKGKFDILPWEPIAFENSGKKFIVECKYGDEALFLREVILICLAHILGVLNDNWISRYRKAERIKRALIGLAEEIKYNNRVMQGYFGVLTEAIKVINNGSPKFITNVSETIVAEADTFLFPVYIDSVRDYIYSAMHFNQNIDSIDPEKVGFHKNKEMVSKLIEGSNIQSRVQSLWWQCDKFINEYPYWTFNYI